MSDRVKASKILGRLKPRVLGGGLAPAVRPLRQQGQQRLQRAARIAGQGQRRRKAPKHLLGVDVEPDQRAGQRHRAAVVHVIVGRAKLGADREHHVRPRDQPPCRRERRAAGQAQRMLGRQDAAAVGGHDRGRPQAFRQRARRGSRAERAAAQQQQRPARLSQHRGRLPQRRGACHRARGARHRCRERRCLRAQQVGRDLDMHRARPAAIEHRERPRDHLRQFGQRRDGMRERRDAAAETPLVGQFVQPALAGTGAAGRVDTGDHQHRHRIGIGLRHRRQRVGQAGAADEEAHARPTTGACVAVRHEGGRLLVARRDVADAAGGEAAIHLDGVDAGNAEHQVDSVLLEQRGQHLSAGRHVSPPLTRCAECRPMGVRDRRNPALVRARSHR